MAAIAAKKSCIKHTFFVLNFILWLSGVALLGVGIWLYFNDRGFHILKLLEAVDFKDEFFTIALYVMMGSGALLFLVGFLGCSGAVSEDRGTLIAYGVLVTIILAGQLAVGSLMVIYRNKFYSEGLEAKMKEQIEEEYLDETTVDGVTRSWNFIQIYFRCCGVNGPADYANSNFTRNNPDKPVPYTCCKFSDTSGSFPKPINETQCFHEANSTNSTYAFNAGGCYKPIQDWVGSRSVIVLALAFAVAGFQLVVIALCCVLLAAIRSYRDQQPSKYM